MTVDSDAPRRLLSVAEALAAVRAEARPLPPVRVGLVGALGLVLAEDVVADIDLPPFDKALVDGFAVRSADVPGVSARLVVVDEVFAGGTPTRPVGPGEATAIMTGAPLPDGADAVVMVEVTSRPDPGSVVVAGPVAPGQNRLVRGREMRLGEVVVPAGSTLNAARMGVLASVGRVAPLVRPRPRVSIVTTGDELVPADVRPVRAQIRDSNSVLLAALAREHGAIPHALPIVEDEPGALAGAFRDALDGEPADPRRADVLIVSGGVSAGRKDLVPEALTAVGVREVFHKVRVKPGKPLWFGVGPDRGDAPPALVFGLPGNPVSGLVGFLLFIRPALDVLSGACGRGTSTLTLPLSVRVDHADDRDVYRPARLVAWRAGLAVEPIAWAGSPDLRAAATAVGFAIFPAGERIYEEGGLVEFLPNRPSRSGPGFTY